MQAPLLALLLNQTMISHRHHEYILYCVQASFPFLRRIHTKPDFNNNTRTAHLVSNMTCPVYPL
jgi:hypothetical protein